jgi:hypothetical protein
MNEEPELKFAFITDPERGVAVLNIQVEGSELQRFRLNREHLFNLNKQTADILVKEFK